MGDRLTRNCAYPGVFQSWQPSVNNYKRNKIDIDYAASGSRWIIMVFCLRVLLRTDLYESYTFMVRNIVAYKMIIRFGYYVLGDNGFSLYLLNCFLIQSFLVIGEHSPCHKTRSLSFYSVKTTKCH